MDIITISLLWVSVNAVVFFFWMAIHLEAGEKMYVKRKGRPVAPLVRTILLIVFACFFIPMAIYSILFVEQ